MIAIQPLVKVMDRIMLTKISKTQKKASFFYPVYASITRDIATINTVTAYAQALNQAVHLMK